MQDIIFYVDASNAVGVCRDSLGVQTVAAPTMILGSRVRLRMRLLTGDGTDTPLPISQLENCASWEWNMDSDWKHNTPLKVTADNANIVSATVTKTDSDGVETSYTEVQIPILDINSPELNSLLTDATVSLGGELVGFDSNGELAFILQVDNFTIRNRRSASEPPTATVEQYLDAAQTRALITELEGTQVGIADADLTDGVASIVTNNNVYGVIDEAGTQWIFSDEIVSYSQSGTVRTATVDLSGVLAKRGITEIPGTWYIILTGGQPGATWTSGTIAPNSSDGANGDFYFLSSTGDIYKKTSGAWNVVFNITGIIFRGGYVSGTTYLMGDAVTYDGSLYISSADSNTGNQPDTSSGHWTKAGAKGDKGDKGDVGATGTIGSNSGIVIGDGATDQNYDITISNGTSIHGILRWNCITHKWTFSDDGGATFSDFGSGSGSGSAVFSGIRVEGVGLETTYHASIDDMVTYLLTLNTATVPGVTITFPAGDFSTSNAVTLPAMKTNIQGAGRPFMLTFSAGLVFASDCTIRDASIIGAVTLAGSYVSGCNIAGVVTCSGPVELSDVYVNGGITVPSATSLLCSRCYVLGTIAAAASCKLYNTTVSAENDSASAVTSTGTPLEMRACYIENWGSGGGINCDNGASASLPNVLTDIVCRNTTISAGSAVTVIGNVYTVTAITGNAIIRTSTEQAWHEISYAASIYVSAGNGNRQKIDTCTGALALTAPTLSATIPSLRLQVDPATYAVTVGGTEVIASGSSSVYLIEWYWDGATTRRRAPEEVI